MRPLPTVRVIEALEPIPLGDEYEVRVELVEVDGIPRVRVRTWKRVPEAEDVALHAAAIRQLIASLAITAPESAESFIREASEIVAMYLQFRETPTARSLDLLIVPSAIMRCLRESGILARYRISEPETVPHTFDMQAWVPTDEVMEAEDLNGHGWATVVWAADQYAIDEHLAEHKRKAAANDNTGEK